MIQEVKLVLPVKQDTPWSLNNGNIIILEYRKWYFYIMRKFYFMCISEYIIHMYIAIIYLPNNYYDNSSKF